MAGRVLEDPIPQIHWESMPHKEAMANLDACVKACDNRSGWDSFNLFTEWVLYGFGDSQMLERPVGLEPDLNARWYKLFNLGLYLRDPYDYFGHYVAEFYGAGKHNRTAYFPTPMNVCVMMAQMMITEDAKTKSVCDPCVGSGRLLLAASNYSLNLYGMDIDYRILNVCRLNMWMYVPWAISRPANIDGLMGVTLESPEPEVEPVKVETISEITPELQIELLKGEQLQLF